MPAAVIFKREFRWIQDEFLRHAVERHPMGHTAMRSVPETYVASLVDQSPFLCVAQVGNPGELMRFSI
jgi:hypothetical protein